MARRHRPAAIKCAAPPPRLPPVSAAAHAACANKAAGSALTWDPGDGAVMQGVCAKRNGRTMVALRGAESNG